jgi:hypothetical protein
LVHSVEDLRNAGGRLHSRSIVSQAHAGQSGFKRFRRGLFNARELWDALFGFVDVLNIALQNQQVRRRSPIDFQRSAIVPLDGSFYFFSVLLDEIDGRVGLDLLLVFVILGVRLRWWRLPLAHLD